MWRAAEGYPERLNPDVYCRRKPHEIPPDDLASVLDEYAPVVTEQISNPDERRAVKEKLDRLTDRLRQSANARTSRSVRSTTRRVTTSRRNESLDA